MRQGVLRVREPGPAAPLPHTESLAVTSAHVGISLDLGNIYICFCIIYGRAEGQKEAGNFLLLRLSAVQYFSVT